MRFLWTNQVSGDAAWLGFVNLGREYRITDDMAAGWWLGCCRIQSTEYWIGSSIHPSVSELPGRVVRIARARRVQNRAPRPDHLDRRAGRGEARRAIPASRVAAYAMVWAMDIRFAGRTTRCLVCQWLSENSRFLGWSEVGMYGTVGKSHGGLIIANQGMYETARRCCLAYVPSHVSS